MPQTEPYCEKPEALPGKLGYKYPANMDTSELPLTCRNSDVSTYPYMCIPVSISSLIATIP